MWSCPNCQNENEDNFKFCWSCGQTRADPEVFAPEEKAEEEVKEPEPPPQPVKPAIVERLPETEEKASTVKVPIAQVPIAKVSPVKVSTDDDEEVLPMLAHLAGVEREVSPTDQEISLERKIFTIAVRLLGLFLLYQVFVALPDLLALLYAQMPKGQGTDRPLAMVVSTLLSLPVAKLLLNLIVGIYLIASGRILLWMLPRR